MIVQVTRINSAQIEALHRALVSKENFPEISSVPYITVKEITGASPAGETHFRDSPIVYNLTLEVTAGSFEESGPGRALSAVNKALNLFVKKNPK